MIKNKVLLKKKLKYLIIIFVILIILVVVGYKFIDERFDNLITEDFNILESPYTVNQIYEIIESNKLFRKGFSYFNQDSIELGYILMNFYDYFDKDTLFLVANKLDDYGQPLEFKYITYSEYRNQIKMYKVLNGENILPNYYIRSAREFLVGFALNN